MSRARVVPTGGQRQGSGSFGGSVASARRLGGTPHSSALAAQTPPRVDADGYLDFVPRAALDGGGAGSGRFPGAGRDRGIAMRPSKDERGDGTAGGGSRPAVRKPVRVDPTKEKPYTAKFITERKAGAYPGGRVA